MITKAFTTHPASVGESYFEHLLVALSFAGRMLWGAVVCCLHAFFPFLFERTGSQIITELHDRMVVHRNRH